MRRSSWGSALWAGKFRCGSHSLLSLLIHQTLCHICEQALSSFFPDSLAHESNLVYLKFSMTSFTVNQPFPLWCGKPLTSWRNLLCTPWIHKDTNVKGNCNRTPMEHGRS
jgi:hypothetical protein